MTEKNAIAIAKDLAKRLKAKMAEDPDSKSFEVSFDRCVTSTTYCQPNKPAKCVYAYNGEKRIEFNRTDDLSDYGRFSRLVREKLLETLKRGFDKFIVVPHNGIVHYTPRGTPWYSSYANQEIEVFKGITLVCPCKEFSALQKRAEHFGFTIKPLDWRTDYVSGKRSSYSVTGSCYFCTLADKCKRIMDALKGMKKATLEIKRYEHLGDMEYGERYETEWSGSIDYALKVVTSKTTTIV